MICAPKMAHFYKLMQQELFRQNCARGAFENYLEVRTGAGGLGRTCSGWILDRSVVGWGAPPVVTQKTAANPGQGWQASNPLEILGVWLVERTFRNWQKNHPNFQSPSLLGKRQNAQPVGKSFTLTKMGILEVCVFVSYLQQFWKIICSSEASQAIICNLIRRDIWRLICPFMWSVICSSVRNLICSLIWSVICSLTRAPIPSTKWPWTKTSDMLCD